MTVLSNEQVIDGRGWRSGALVEKRKLNQWFLRITQFADELLEGLKALDHWPDKVKLMQENWIGRSRGLTFGFEIAGGAERIEVFSTRPDTIFGASFVAVPADLQYAQAHASHTPWIPAVIPRLHHAVPPQAATDAQKKLSSQTVP